MQLSSGNINWRDFFDQGELENLISHKDISINKGKKHLSKNEIREEPEGDSDAEKSDKADSDSDPSEDNMDAGEFLQIIQAAFKDDEEVTFKELE